MKTTSASVFLLFVLFGLANAANNAVLDINGEEVVTGVPYYVVSAIWGAGGGGLAIGRESGRKCPEIVVQRRSDMDYGNPVIISIADANDDVVRVSSDINLKFTGKRDRLCQTSTVWKVQHRDDSTGKRFVELGGEEGNPGCDTKKSWFKMRRPARNVCTNLSTALRYVVHPQLLATKLRELKIKMDKCVWLYPKAKGHGHGYLSKQTNHVVGSDKLFVLNREPSFCIN